MKIFFLIFFLAINAVASVSRTIDADAVISSNHTKTYTFPSAAGPLLGSGSYLPEIPTGTINGTNTAFTLANTPLASGTVSLYLDGIFLIQGTDYTISGTSITMTTAPSTGQKISALYLK